MHRCIWIWLTKMQNRQINISIKISVFWWKKSNNWTIDMNSIGKFIWRKTIAYANFLNKSTKCVQYLFLNPSHFGVWKQKDIQKKMAHAMFESMLRTLMHYLWYYIGQLLTESTISDKQNWAACVTQQQHGM